MADEEKKVVLPEGVRIRKRQPNQWKNISIEGDLGLPKANPEHRSGGLPKELGRDVRKTVAVMSGMGIAAKSIAEQVGIRRNSTEKIINTEIPHDKELRRLQTEAAAQHFPTTKNLVEKIHAAIDKGIGLFNEHSGTENARNAPTLRELTYAMDVMGQRVLYPNAEEHEVKKTQVSINVKDPVALRDLFAAMRGEETKVIDVTPEPAALPEHEG